MTVDEAALADLEKSEGGWLLPEGPHVRPDRAGLRLVAEQARIAQG